MQAPARGLLRVLVLVQIESRVLAGLGGSEVWDVSVLWVTLVVQCVPAKPC